MSIPNPIDAMREEINRRLKWFKELMALLNVPAEKVVETVRGLEKFRMIAEELTNFLDLLGGNLKVKNGEWAQWSLGQRIEKVLTAHDALQEDARLGKMAREIANRYPQLRLKPQDVLGRAERDIDLMGGFNKPIEIDLSKPSPEEPYGVPWPDVEFQPTQEQTPTVEPVLPQVPTPSWLPVLPPSPSEPTDTEIVDEVREKRRSRGLLETLGLKPRG